MIVELIAAGLVVSACLAIYLDETVYSVASLACMFVLTTILYALSNAVFVAVFQLTVAAGTLAVLFLAGEMLSEKPVKEKPLKKTFLVVLLALFLSFPSIFLSIAVTPANVSPNFSFADALWNFRAIDVILQGLVIMTVALGIAIVLYERKEGKS
ncbi:MAG: NADH-quinone oxidoreductase subunit J [Candidatus Bathycorpusculaceae bacterium]